MSALSYYSPTTNTPFFGTATPNLLSWLWPGSKHAKSQTKSPNGLWALLSSTYQALMTQINATYNSVTAWLQYVFFYHYTYYQILVVTEQWGLFAATIAGIVVESTLLKIIMSIAESTWATAMNEKNPLLWSIGMRYLRIFATITALEMFFEYVQTFFNKTISKTLKTKVVEKLESKQTFRAIKESERGVNDNPKQSGLAKVIAEDAEDFLSNFIKIHYNAFFIATLMVSCAIGLAEVGLLYEGAKVFAICVAAGAVLIYRYTNKESNQKLGAQHENFDRTINYLIVEENRAQNLPNWLRVYTKTARDNINEAFRIANENILSNSLLNKILEMTFKIADPIFILTMFLTPYLTGGMAFAQLAQILQQLKYLCLAGGAVIASAPYLGEMANFAENTSRVIRNYFLNKLPDVPTHRGLEAKGELKYQAKASDTAEDTSSAEKVLTFFAEVKSAATNKRDLSRQYGTKEKPLTFEPNTLVYVLGENGAGKSVFLDALDPRFEFGIGGDAGKGDYGFCLHCEQEIITLPTRVDRSEYDESKDKSWTNQFMNFWQPNKSKAGKQSESDQQHSKPKPWTVAQIIAMLWPQNLSEEIENIDDESVLELQRGAESIKPNKIKVADLLALVDHYMEALNLSAESIRDKNFNDMSGGQKCKLRLAIYFAMAECIEPRLFMIDEPYNHLDQASRAGVRKILDEFKGKKAGTTTFVVTHEDNKSNCLGLYDKVIAMRNHNEPVVYDDVVGQEGTFTSNATGYYKHIEDNNIGCEHISDHRIFALPK